MNFPKDVRIKLGKLHMLLGTPTWIKNYQAKIHVTKELGGGFIFFWKFSLLLGGDSHFDGVGSTTNQGIWAMFFWCTVRWIFDKLDGAPVAKTLQQETEVSKNNWNFIGLSFFCLGGGLKHFFSNSHTLLGE